MSRERDEPVDTQHNLSYSVECQFSPGPHVRGQQLTGDTMLMQSDPFRDLDNLFNRLSSRQANASGVMPMDAFRRGSDVWVHIDLPGVKAESLDITVERNVLTVAAERNWQRQENDQ